MATAFDRRTYAGGAVSTTLSASMAAGDTTFTITSNTGWTFTNNFYVVIDRGLSTEEKVYCASISSSTVTVASSGRGVDGTTASPHSSGATIQVCHVARDDDEANQLTNLMGNGAEGSLFYGKGAATLPAKLAIGIQGKVLVSNGTDPTWGSVLTPTAQNGNYNANNGDLVILSTGKTVTLPTASAGLMVGVYTTDANASNGVTAGGSDKVYGSGLSSSGVAAGTNVPLSAVGSFAILFADAALSWRVISGQQDSGWIAVANGSMTNSWTNGGVAFGYRLQGNHVYLRGQLSGGGSASAALTLPSGYRPATAVNVALSESTFSNPAACSITTGGVLTIATTSTKTYALDNFNFTVD